MSLFTALMIVEQTEKGNECWERIFEMSRKKRKYRMIDMKLLCGCALKLG